MLPSDDPYIIHDEVYALSALIASIFSAADTLM